MATLGRFHNHKRCGAYKENAEAFIKSFNAEVVAAYTTKSRNFPKGKPYYADKYRIECDAIDVKEGPEVAFVTPYTACWSGSYYCTTMDAAVSNADNNNKGTMACRLCANPFTLESFDTFEHKEKFEDLKAASSLLIGQMQYCPGCLICSLTTDFRVVICKCCGGRKRMTHRNTGKRTVSIGPCLFTPVPVTFVRKYSETAKTIKESSPVAVASTTPKKVKPEPTRRKTKRQRNGKFKTAVSSPSLPIIPRSPTISLSSATASCAENLSSSSSSEEGDDNDYVGAESAGATIAASVLTNFNTYAADGDNNSDTTMEPPPAKRRLTVHPSKRVVDIDLEAEDYQGLPRVHESSIVVYREVYKLGASQVARLRPDRMLSDDLITIAIKGILAPRLAGATPSIHFLSSNCMEMIAGGNLDSTRPSRVADKLFKYDIVLAPYNFDKHFVLFVFSNLGRTSTNVPCSAFYLDSNIPTDDANVPMIPPSALGAYVRIKTFILAQAKLRNIEHSFADNILLKRPIVLNVPQQSDSVNCGTFVIWFCRQMIQRASSFYRLTDQKKMAKKLEAIIVAAGDVDVVEVRQSIYRELLTNGVWCVSNNIRSIIYDRISSHADWTDDMDLME